MYKTFSVAKFRCFESLTVESLARVNLIAGKNNVGKSALLEALFLHTGGYSASLVLKIDSFRGLESARVEVARWAEPLWESLFKDWDTTAPIVLSAKNTVGPSRTITLRTIREPEALRKIASTSTGPAFSGAEPVQVLQLEYKEGQRTGSSFLTVGPQGLQASPAPPAPLPSVLLSARGRNPLIEDAQRFSDLERHNEQDVLVQALQVVEPRLQRLALAMAGGVPMLHADVGLPRLVPLPFLGDGMGRLASHVLGISAARNGLCMIDEIENGLHYSVLSNVWTAVGAAARRFDCQVFATTHSLECIRAAHHSFLNSEHYDLRLYRLDRLKDGGIVAKGFDKSTLESAIESDLEVR